MDTRVPLEAAVSANRTLFEAVRSRDDRAVAAAMEDHLRLLEDAWFGSETRLAPHPAPR
jgi:DNA-binding GntR family transcriptional regulator